MKQYQSIRIIGFIAGSIAATAIASWQSHAQSVIYGLTENNSLLVLSADGSKTVPGPSLIGLGAGETAMAIDFRPLNSELYLLTRDAANLGRIYTVDPIRGAVSAVALSGSPFVVTGSADIDFNPAALSGTNALRVVTSDLQNYRLVFGPSGATVNVDGNLNVAGEAASTHIIATAYSNNRAGLPGRGGIGGTAQYAIDSATDRLFRVNPPNNGTLTNGLPLGIDISEVGALDIVTGSDRGIALLTVAGTRGFYEINLATGAATFVSTVANQLISLAAPIPNPDPLATIYGLTATNSLVRFGEDSQPVTPGPVVTGLGFGETLVGIDFRPLSGELYGLSRDSDGMGRLYQIQGATGVAISVPLVGPPIVITGSVGMDFNPAAASGVNALRIVTSDEQNYRLLFSSTNATVNIDAALNVAGGAIKTNVVATAYSNNRAGLPGGGGAGGTVQYAIDSDMDVIYRVSPPNNGVLTNALSLGIDLTEIAGLDISTRSDRAIGLFRVGSETVIYQIDVRSGGATPIRFLPNGIEDIAIPIPVALSPSVVVGLTSTNSLVTLGTETGSSTIGPSMSGLGLGELVVGIDFRPFTGELYALTRDASNIGRLYTVDPRTGITTPVPLQGAQLLISGSMGIDFNPAAVGGTNALRIISSDKQNYRIIFGEGGATVNADGGLNAAGATSIHATATAYSNNRVGLPGGAGVGGTAQYALDSDLNLLYRVNPPNNGTLIEPKALGIDIRATAGLDISTDEDRAIAVLDALGVVGLFEINLATGEPTFLRSLAPNVIDLAIATPARVHLIPASGTLVISGGVGPFGVLRSDVVNEPFCGIAATAQRSIVVPNDGPAGFFGITDLADAAPVRFTVFLDGTSERPTPATGAGDGLGTLEIAGNTLTVNIGYRGLSGPATGAHLHGPATTRGVADVLVDLSSLNGGAFGTNGNLSGSVAITAEVKAALLNGLTYVNIHSASKPAGEIRGQVSAAVHRAVLTGASERPVAAASRASGSALLTLIGRELAFEIEYQGLSSPATLAHIQGPSSSSDTSGVLLDLAPFHVGPFGRVGRFVGNVSLTPEQFSALVDGQSYINIHTPNFGGGEIRGQVRGVFTGTAYSAELSGAAERPTPVVSTGSGFASAHLNGDTLTFRINYANLGSSLVAAHLHGPANAAGASGVYFDLLPFHRGAVGLEGVFVGSVRLTQQQKAAVISGDTYFNLHTSINPGGEIRGQLSPVIIPVSLNGASEQPTPVTTSAVGNGYVATLGRQCSFGVRYDQLSGPALAVHLHGPATTSGTADVLVNLAPLAKGGRAASGYLLGTIQLSANDLASLVDGLTYLNIHTAVNEGGEIRGQLVP